MTNYIIRRLLLNVLVLWLVATMVFLGTHALPSDFAQKRIASSMTGASQAEAIELARHELGLDKPLWRQYLDFMGELSRGDLGHSYESKLSTWTEVGRRVTTTLELGIMTLIISFAISIPVGIISAVKQNTWIDYLLRGFAILGVAIGIAAGLFALTLMVWRPWSSLGSTKPTPAGSPSVPSIASGPAVQGSGSLLNPLGLAPSPAATPAPPKRTVRILGGAGMSKDRQGWRYLLDSGEILTAAQITGRYGLMVSEVYEEGSMRLIGEGVFYGPAGD